MKILRNIGIVASVVGGGIACYGYSKYSEAKSMLKALRDGDRLLGTNSTKSIDLWSGYSDNYKLILIVGAIILICGIIFFISGLMSGNNNRKLSPMQSDSTSINSNVDISDRLKKLERLKKEGVISSEEYEEKRKELISLL